MHVVYKQRLLPTDTHIQASTFMFKNKMAAKYLYLAE